MDAFLTVCFYLLFGWIVSRLLHTYLSKRIPHDDFLDAGPQWGFIFIFWPISLMIMLCWPLLKLLTRAVDRVAVWAHQLEQRFNA